MRHFKNIFVLHEKGNKKAEGYINYLLTLGYNVKTSIHKDEYSSAITNSRNLAECNEVHLFYDQTPYIHMYLGVAFAYGRKLIVMDNTQAAPAFIKEWESIFKDNLNISTYENKETEGL